LVFCHGLRFLNREHLAQYFFATKMIRQKEHFFFYH
jgi:hypothetical protein